MSDIHRFSRTFLSGGLPVEVDSDLTVLLRDSYGNPALTVALADGQITLDSETLCYSFTAELAWLSPGPVTAAWSARVAGQAAQGSPIVELRPRIPTHARNFGATVPDVLERMRGLAKADFAPLLGGSSGDGEAVLGRFLNSASAVIAAALPQVYYGLLTRMKVVLCESTHEGITHLAVPLCGGEISAVALYLNDSQRPLAPDKYSLDGSTIVLTTAPSVGTRIRATVEYCNMAPALLTEHTTMLAAVESCLSLIPAGTDSRGRLLEEHSRFSALLGAIQRGEFVMSEWNNLPLEGVILPRPATLTVGRLAQLRDSRG